MSTKSGHPISRRAPGAGAVLRSDVAAPLLAPTRPIGGSDVIPIKYSNAGDAPPTTTISDNGWQNRIFDCRVYLIFWGSAWDTVSSPNPKIVDVVNDVASILAGPYQAALTQYVNSNPAKLELVYRASGDPPNPFSQSDVENLVLGAWNAGQIFNDPGGFFCVMMPPGTTFNGGAVGAHSAPIDWGGTSRGVYVGWVQYASRAGISSTFSHELVEAITDPNGDGIQVNPRNGSNWNEIGDVCTTIAALNGVVVQSYWSQADLACVIPMNVPVRKQITCIHKVPRDDTRHSIQLVGGFTLQTGQAFVMSQLECIIEIDRGNTFFVVGSDGSEAEVKVFIHFPPWQPSGMRYIATVPDASLGDNLLSLPECPGVRR